MVCRSDILATSITRKPWARKSASTVASRPRCLIRRALRRSRCCRARAVRCAGARSTTRIRPHEAIELDVPSSRYRSMSARLMSETIGPFEYAPRDIVRRVQQGGHVSILGRSVKVPKAFRGKAVAFRATTHDGVFDRRLPNPRGYCNHRIHPTSSTRKPKSVHDVSEHLSTLSPV